MVKKYLNYVWICLICLLGKTTIFAKHILTTPQIQKKRVVLVSWDGFQPAFITDPRFQTPHIQALVKSGAYSLDMIPVFPTLTYPNHTSLITGVSPIVHGIDNNNLFDKDKGPLPEWHWDSRSIKTPTLWEKAEEKGLHTAIVRWPVSLNAQVTWNFPEIFKVHGMSGTHKQWVEKFATPGLVQELEKGVGRSMPPNMLWFLAYDDWLADSTVYLEKTYQPDLQLIHLLTADIVQHELGQDSLPTQWFVFQLDKVIGKLATELKKDPNVCLVVVGDHGHRDFRQIFYINSLLQKSGYITTDHHNHIIKWSAIARANGGSAEIFVRDPHLEPVIYELLQKNLDSYFKIFKNQDIKNQEILSFPKASFILAAPLGISFDGEITNVLTKKISFPQSTHGYLATEPPMHTVFSASGCGIEPNQRLETVHLLQVAPTLWEILQLDQVPFEKEALKLKFSM